MSIPNWLLIDVAIAEGALLVLAWLFVLLHGVRSARVRAREPRIAEARDAVVRGLLAGGIRDEDRETLQRLSRAERVRLFNRVAPNLRGRERGWLGQLADEMGLVAYGKSMIRSPFWWRRLRGARLLTLAGGAGDAVLRLAEDPHPLIRSQVSEWCGANPSDEAMAVLIRHLGDPVQGNRFTVQDALVRLGADAIEPLTEKLERIPISPGETGPGRDEYAALAGLSVARGIGDSRLADAVLRLADHPSPAVRKAAFRALGTAGGPEAADRLIEGLEDPDAEVRTAAARALGELEHWPAGPSLVKALADPSWDVRAASGRALIRIGPPGEILLRRASHSEDSFAADMAQYAMDTAGVVTRFQGA